MGYAAIECLDKATEDTKELLFPFSLKTWAKLAVIAVLAGGSGGFNLPNIPSGGSDYNPETNAGGTELSGIETSFSQGLSPVTGAFASSTGDIAVAGIAIAFVSILLGFMYISSVFEFVYYKSLIDSKVRIVENFRDNAGSGFRVFSFRVLWSILLLTIVGLGIAMVILQPLAAVPLILLAIPLLLLSALVSTFVNTFVVLKMLESEKGFLDSAKNVYSDLRPQWKEFLVYFLMQTIVSMAVGIIVFLGAITALILLAIPLAIIGALLYIVSELLLIPVIIVGVFVWALIVLIGLTAPTSTFIYYYSIEVYHSLTS